MSLLINGIEMPKNCRDCFLYDSAGFCALDPTREFEDYNHKRPDDCTLVEIPTPHGRLIDADAHIQSLKDNQCRERCRKNHDCVNCGIGMYIRIVENESTILEAEE